jgi:hypothetical protein
MSTERVWLNEQTHRIRNGAAICPVSPRSAPIVAEAIPVAWRSPGLVTATPRLRRRSARCGERADRRGSPPGDPTW